MTQLLNGGPRANFDPADVLASLTLRGGRRVAWGVDVLDTSDDLTDDTVPIDLDAGGSVDWSFRVPDSWSGQETQQAAVRRTASITLASGSQDATNISSLVISRRFRVWMELGYATDQTTGLRVPVRWHEGVFEATLPPMEDDGVVIRQQLDLADKSHRWSTTTLVEPINVDAGVNPIDWVKSDLQTRFGEAVFQFPATTVTLDQPYFFDVGGTILDVYGALFDAVAYDLTVDEEGRPLARPLSSLNGQSSSYTYGAGNMPIQVAGTLSALLPAMPNVVRFVARAGPSLPEEGNGIITISNSSTGPASIAGRGGELIEMVVDSDVEDQAALNDFAQAQAQIIFAGGGMKFDGKIGLNPSLSDRDLLTVIKPRLGMTGDWNVTSWQLPLQRINSDAAVLMDISCEQKVATTTGAVS